MSVETYPYSWYYIRFDCQIPLTTQLAVISLSRAPAALQRCLHTIDRKWEVNDCTASCAITIKMSRIFKLCRHPHRQIVRVVTGCFSGARARTILINRVQNHLDINCISNLSCSREHPPKFMALRRSVQAIYDRHMGTAPAKKMAVSFFCGVCLIPSTHQPQRAIDMYLSCTST